MLYRTLKRMIERGQTGGIETKIDIFFAAGKLTEEEYNELIGMLNKDATAVEKK
nr:MAG TPA: Short C-terminal domain [Caudoviricetes sp.]